MITRGPWAARASRTGHASPGLNFSEQDKNTATCPCSTLDHSSADGRGGGHVVEPPSTSASPCLVPLNEMFTPSVHLTNTAIHDHLEFYFDWLAVLGWNDPNWVVKGCWRVM